MNLSDSLNLGCMCRTLDPARLRDQLETDPRLAGLAEQLAGTHPHLFSQTVVFLDPETRDAVARAVAAIERVMALPAWQEAALADAPAIARHRFGPAGVFMGYDFHVGPDGPRLIEINTNAGGAFLNAALARAHRACCESMGTLFDAGTPGLPALDDTFVAMFRAEWQAQRGALPLRNIVIVDDAPAAQYLAPEFQLARHVFETHGLVAVVADASELQWRDGHLWHPGLPAGTPVDLVYNRLTDFDLSLPSHEALRQAYESGAAVVTPHPHAHAVQADKRNLIRLGDDALLASWGVSEPDRAALRAAVPATCEVTPQNADDLWARRRQLFFKPAAGYGAKAAYRGDKLTRKAWGDITAGGFVAQALVPPSERLVDVDGQPTRLKLDLRAYAWRGNVQLLAARTWAGQTTNFRTAGGGFSPVVVLPVLAAAPCGPASSPSLFLETRSPA